MRAKILIFLYLATLLVPYYGAADKVDSQTLYLNILNFLNVFLLIKDHRKNVLVELYKSVSNVPVVFMTLFFTWSSITIIKAVNTPEALISLSEMLTILIALIFLIYYFRQIQKNSLDRLILILIILLTTIELISVYLPYLADIIAYGQPKFQSQAYRGVSGNINVMSYSLLLKLPFLIYFLYLKKFNRLILFVYIVLVSFAIFSILETRSAILSLFLITFILSFLFFLFQKNKKNLFKVFRSVLLPILIGFIFSLIQTNYISKPSLQDRMGTLLEIENDQSINQRFRYYKAAIASFIDNPILGIGVGNWEVESIKYDRKNMRNYVVPYHAHNDFLEILAESGIPAPLLYFGPLFFIMFLILKKILNGELKKEKDLFLIVIFCSFLAYLLDSMFNFPQARIMSQINLIFLLAISVFYFNLNIKISRKILKLFLIIFIPLIILSAYSSILVYKSSKEQFILFLQFNNSDWSYPSLEVVEKMEDDYPNLSPTAMPLSAMKAMYFLKGDKPDTQKAIKLFKESLPHNPYLYLSESFLGYAYDLIGDNENGIKYSKMAFENAPNDLVHFGNYVNSLYELKDSIGIKNAFLSISDEYKDPLHDEIYLLVNSSLTDPSSNFTIEGIDINYQTGTDRVKKGFYISQVGSLKTYEANKYYLLAMEYYKEENYSEAIRLFLEAAKYNPYELVYLENAANSYMKIGKDEEALELLNKLINEYDAETPKVFYLRGLLLFGFDRKEEACRDFKIVYDTGQMDRQFYFNFCN